MTHQWLNPTSIGWTHTISNDYQWGRSNKTESVIFDVQIRDDAKQRATSENFKKKNPTQPNMRTQHDDHPWLQKRKPSISFPIHCKFTAHESGRIIARQAAILLTRLMPPSLSDIQLVYYQHISGVSTANEVTNRLPTYGLPCEDEKSLTCDLAVAALIQSGCLRQL